VADLIGRTGGPGWSAATLVERCLAVARQHLPTPVPGLERHRRRALRQLAAAQGRCRLVSWPTWLYARAAAQHAITAIVLTLRRLPVDRRDVALLAILEAAISAMPPGAPSDPARAETESASALAYINRDSTA
jgi:hypothetical protein